MMEVNELEVQLHTADPVCSCNGFSLSLSVELYWTFIEHISVVENYIDVIGYHLIIHP